MIVGGESGPAARPTQKEWVLSLRDQCARAGVTGKTPGHTFIKAEEPDTGDFNTREITVTE
jgi:protein gp37